MTPKSLRILGTVLGAILVIVWFLQFPTKTLGSFWGVAIYLALFIAAASCFARASVLETLPRGEQTVTDARVPSDFDAPSQDHDPVETTERKKGG